MSELKELSINTIKVEIKTLSIDGKQMTLSVFKQIPIKQLDDWHDVLGWVCCRINNHNYWSVFTEDGILYKGYFNNAKSYPKDQLYISI